MDDKRIPLPSEVFPRSVPRQGEPHQEQDDANPAPRARHRAPVPDAPPPNPDKTGDVLNGVLQALKNAESGFQNLAEHADSNRLVALFSDRSHERAGWALSLEHLIEACGVKPKQSGTLGGSVQRVISNVRESISGADKAHLLNQAVKCEEGVIKAYEKALQSKHVTGDGAEMLHEQWQQLRSSLKELTALSDMAVRS